MAQTSVSKRPQQRKRQQQRLTRMDKELIALIGKRPVTLILNRIEDFKREVVIDFVDPYFIKVVELNKGSSGKYDPAWGKRTYWINKSLIAEIEVDNDNGTGQ